MNFLTRAYTNHGWVAILSYCLAIITAERVAMPNPEMSPRRIKIIEITEPGKKPDPMPDVEVDDDDDDDTQPMKSPMTPEYVPEEPEFEPAHHP
jgi:hypothetical protein